MKKKIFLFIRNFFTSDLCIFILWLFFSILGFIEAGRAIPVYDSICSGVIPSNYLDICSMYTSGICLGIGFTHLISLVISLFRNCFVSGKEPEEKNVNKEGQPDEYI